VLTTREPQGQGAIAGYLSNWRRHSAGGISLLGPGLRTALLQQEFDIAPIYPQPRQGADGTRINFFLVAAPTGGKILIEIYEPAKI